MKEIKFAGKKLLQKTHPRIRQRILKLLVLTSIPNAFRLAAVSQIRHLITLMSKEFSLKILLHTYSE